jgi:hypothetical protein
MPRGWFYSQLVAPARAGLGFATVEPGGLAEEKPAEIADVELADGAIEGGSSQRSGPRLLERARSLLFGAIAVSLLLWVALYNGYPTVYPDTASYVYTGAFGIPLFPFRSPGYGVFAMVTSLGAGLWFTVIAQGIIVVFALYELCKHSIGGDPAFRDYSLLGIVGFLAAVSSLPWETSLVMPDVFAGVVFLALFLLAFARLNFLERLALAAISALGAGGHASLLPVSALFVLALAIIRLGSSALPGAPSAKGVLPWLVVPLLAAGLWNANLNRRMGLGFQLSPATNEFLFGRLLNDGLAPAFLRANCPQRSFVACRYLDDLPRTPEQFMYWHSLLRSMDKDEVREIVRGTLAAYPLRFAWNSAKHTLRQFVQFKTGDEARDLALHAVNSNGPVISQVFPRDLGAYSASKLIQGRLIRLTKIAAGVDTGVFWLSAIACAAVAFSGRDRNWNSLLFSAILFLFLNAAVCATFAGVYDRYQARVAWIVPLCLALFLCRRLANERPDSDQAGIFRSFCAVPPRMASRSESVSQGASKILVTGSVSHAKG